MSWRYLLRYQSEWFYHKKIRWKKQKNQTSSSTINERKWAEPSITETWIYEWVKKKRLHSRNDSQKTESFQQNSAKRWNDIISKNEKKLKDESSIRDCINDERKKKQSRKNTIFTTRNIAKISHWRSMKKSIK